MISKSYSFICALVCSTVVAFIMEQRLLWKAHFRTLRKSRTAGGIVFGGTPVNPAKKVSQPETWPCTLCFSNAGHCVPRHSTSIRLGRGLSKKLGRARPKGLDSAGQSAWVSGARIQRGNLASGRLLETVLLILCGSNFLILRASWQSPRS